MNHILITKENYNDFKDLLPSNLSGGDRITIGAYDDEGFVCGTVSVVRVDDAYELDWIYVAEARRRQGVGNGLISELVKMTNSIDGLPLRANFEAGDDDGLYMFFRAFDRDGLEFDMSYLYDRYYIKPEEMDEVIKTQFSKGEPEGAEEFFRRPDHDQRALLEQFEELFSVDNLEIWRSTCVPELCRVAFMDEKLAALILVSKRTDGNLELSFLYGANHQMLFMLLKYCITEARKLSPDAGLVFDTVSEESEKMAKKLFPKAEPIQIFEAEM